MADSERTWYCDGKKTPKGTSRTLLNTGVDVIPTLCDFAGISVPAGLPGKSLKAPAPNDNPEREAWSVERSAVKGGKKL